MSPEPESVPAQGNALAIAHEMLQDLGSQPAEWAPHVAGLALWRLHDAARSRSNLDVSVILAQALAILGVPAEPLPVVVATEPSRTGRVPDPERPRWGSYQPRYTPDRSYTGYLVVHLPAIGRFVDVTAPAGGEWGAERNFYVQLPTSDRLTRQPAGTNRGEHVIGYYPTPAAFRTSWTKDPVALRSQRRQQAATVLAAHILDALRWNATTAPAAGPYPLLARMLRRVGDAPLIVTDPVGCYFRLADRVEMSVMELRQMLC